MSLFATGSRHQALLNRRSAALRYSLGASIVVLLSACGGGGGGDGSGGGGGITPPPPPQVAEVSVSVRPAGNPLPSGPAQTVASVKLSNVGRGVASTTDLSITADAVVQDLKVLNCKSDNAASPCPATGSRMSVINLQPGATLSFDVLGQIKSGTSGTVSIAASAMTRNEGHLSSNSQSVGIKAYSVDVGVQATGPTAALPAGSSFEYVISLSNQGPDTAKDLPLKLVLAATPAANAPLLGRITCTPTGGAVCPSSLDASQMTIPSLPKDARLTFTLPYQFAAGTTAGLILQASAQDKGDSNPANDQAVVITP